MVATTVIIKSISKAEYLIHLLGLDSDSNRSRFGIVLSEYAITAYVKKIRDDDFIIGSFDGQRLTGAVHLAIDDKVNHSEVGVSIDMQYRRQGVGLKLMSHAIALCRNRHIEQLYMMCLSTNTSMISLCKKAGLAVVSNHGESETTIELPSPDFTSISQEFNMCNMVIADSMLKPFSSTWANWLKNKNA